MNKNLLKSDVGIFTSSDGEKTILSQLIDDIGNFGAEPIDLRSNDNKISALILVSDNEFHSNDKTRAKKLLKNALLERIPVLCINWGMYLLNSFFGGLDPILIRSNHDHNGKDLKHPVFISPGGKLSYTIGGSGWVTIPSNHKFALTHKELASELISTIYSEDRILHGIELPGKNWVVGVQWQAHKIENNPKGFDNLLRYISDKV